MRDGLAICKLTTTQGAEVQRGSAEGETQVRNSHDDHQTDPCGDVIDDRRAAGTGVGAPLRQGQVAAQMNKAASVKDCCPRGA